MVRAGVPIIFQDDPVFFNLKSHFPATRRDDGDKLFIIMIFLKAHPGIVIAKNICQIKSLSLK